MTATYGDTDKSISAIVTKPATDGGAISYGVKEGSGDYIDVASDGKLTIKAVPADGKAYVIVTASATHDYAETTKEVTVTIRKAEATVTAKDQSIMIGWHGARTVCAGSGYALLRHRTCRYGCIDYCSDAGLSEGRQHSHSGQYCGGHL